MARILVVDDNLDSREVFESLLRYQGYLVSTAADGVAGLALALVEQPDLIITDILMPEMDGFELARRVRGEPDLARTQVIICTATYLLNDVVVLAAECGVEHVLSKPVEPELLFETVRVALGSEPIAVEATPIDRGYLRLLANTLHGKIEDLKAEVQVRTRAEDALRQSEARFATAFRASPAALVISRLSDGRILDVNASYLRMLGFERDEVIGRSAFELNLYVDRGDRENVLGQLHEQGAAHDMEIALRTKSGAIRAIQCSVERIEIDGEACALSILSDITERKQAEATKEAQTARLRFQAEAARAFAEAGPHYQEVLDRIARVIVEQMCDFCLIRLLSDDGKLLNTAALYAADGETIVFVRRLLASAPLRADEPSLDQQVFHSGQPLLVPVIDRARMRDAVQPEYRDAVERFAPSSMIVVPLRLQGQVTGLIGLYRNQPQTPFDENDLLLAQDLADRAALAIRNAQLYAELQASNVTLERRVDHRTEELRQRTEMIDLAADAIIIRAFETDVVTYWNRGAERLYGWTSEEAHGQYLHSFLRTDFPAPLPDIRAELVSTGYWEGELWHTRRDGRLVIVLSRWSLQRDGASQATGVLEINTDITARKQLEDRIRQQTDRAIALAELSRALAESGLEMQPLFDTIAERISVLVGDSCVLALRSDDGQWLETVAVGHVDPQGVDFMRALFAAAPYRIGEGMAGQVVQTGKHVLLAALPPEQLRAQIKPEYHAYLNRFGVSSLLIVPLRARGYILGTLGVSRDRPGRPYTDEDVVFVQDMADRAGMAIENARLFAQAQHARGEADRANRAKSEFLSGMSHELRTPLNAIMGFTGTMLMKLPGPLTPTQERQLTIVQTSARHLLSLINDILDLAKIESGKVEIHLEPVASQSVIAEVAATLRPLAEEKGLQFHVVVPDAPLIVRSDRRALGQILINLINNAIKFTDTGEVVVTVRTEGHGLRAESANTQLSPQSSVLVAFEVRDTGIGIQPEDQVRLFTEFGRVDSAAVRAREGTGLGLRLSLRLAELLGGRIELASQVGVGSMFTLFLPGE